jgi:hypothetical protein
MKCGKQRRRELHGLLSSCFQGKAEQEPSYPIFEYFKEWPNLDEESFVSLHRLTADNGKRIIDEIVHQIDQIITTIEMVGSPAKPKRQAFRIKRKDSA